MSSNIIEELARDKFSKTRIMRRVVDILQAERVKTARKIEIESKPYPLDTFARARLNKEFEGRFLNALKMLGLSYNDFCKAMEVHVKTEKQKVGKAVTTASLQLALARIIIGDLTGE